MANRAREFIDTFVSASVHEDTRYAAVQDRTAIEQLAARCIDLAQDNGISRAELDAEAGDLAAYFRTEIDRKNVELARLAALAADVQSGAGPLSGKV